MEQIDLLWAFALTTAAGLCTGIGSAIAFFIRKPKYSYLAVLLGFSAGVMIYISFAELLKEAVDKIGFATANVYFFIGFIFITIIDISIPHSYIAKKAAKGKDKLMRTGFFLALGT